MCLEPVQKDVLGTGPKKESELGVEQDLKEVKSDISTSDEFKPFMDDNTSSNQTPSTTETDKLYEHLDIGDQAFGKNELNSPIYTSNQEIFSNSNLDKLNVEFSNSNLEQIKC